MAKFRHHRTLEELTTRNEDEIAKLDADALWQRIEDDDSPEPEIDDDETPAEPTLEDIITKMGEGTPDQRNLLREALATFSDEPMVEIGGQRMTQAQFDAARFPLLPENQSLLEVGDVTPKPPVEDEAKLPIEDEATPPRGRARKS